MRPYFQTEFTENNLRDIQSRISRRVIKLPARSQSQLKGNSGYDSLGRRTSLPREILWIVIEFLDLPDIVNLIQAGVVPWSDWGFGRGRYFSALCPIFSPTQTNSHQDISDPTINTKYLKFLMMSLAYGDESFCKICKTSNKDTTRVYWVWLIRCCDDCISRFTICEYDLIEAGLEVEAELLPCHLPVFRKQFSQWGSVAYKFYWAPDVLYYLKTRHFEFEDSNKLITWYSIVDKYRKWTQIHKINKSKIMGFLAKFRKEDVQEDVLMRCMTFNSAMAHLTVFTNSNWIAIEKILVEEYEVELSKKSNHFSRLLSN